MRCVQTPGSVSATETKGRGQENGRQREIDRKEEERGKRKEQRGKGRRKERGGEGKGGRKGLKNEWRKGLQVTKHITRK